MLQVTLPRSQRGVTLVHVLWEETARALACPKAEAQISRRPNYRVQAMCCQHQDVLILYSTIIRKSRTPSDYPKLLPTVIPHHVPLRTVSHQVFGSFSHNLEIVQHPGSKPRPTKGWPVGSLTKAVLQVLKSAALSPWPGKQESKSLRPFAVAPSTLGSTNC